ncbi:MAG: DUF5060 domain-containing protein [Armatimonadota bacterium]|jgi:hypothetical protein
MNATARALVCCTIALLMTTAISHAQEDCVLAFDRIGDDWIASPIDANTGELALVGERSGALSIEGATPKSFGVTYIPWRDWTGYTNLSFDILLADDMPPGADLQVYIKDRHYWWYQSFPLHRAEGPRAQITPGEWMSFTIDISEDSTAWEPGGHQKAWHRVLHRPREFGVRIFCDEQWQGEMLLANVTLSGWQPPLGRFDPTAHAPLSYGLELDLSGEQVPVYEKLEITFDPGRVYENPFDPEVVDVQAHFLSPDGERLVVPGFFYQDYERSQTEEGWEQLIPVGEPRWKVRFSPTAEGRWRFYVSVRDEKGELRSEERQITATPALDPRGLVRLSEDDPMYFEFDNGELFLVNGINMRDGGDHAERQKGTYAFDHYFKRFEEEGLNFVRTWMAAWWAGIEWDEEYHSRYDGVGRYSTYNAWRLDYMFDLAAEHDLFIELTFNSHGQLRRDKYDAEWRYNPYAARNGGYVASPSMLFTNEQVKADFKKRYRYIVARWGYSRNLLSYDLWNEIDLSEGSNASEIARWHEEMAGYVYDIDPWNHLVTTHVCLYGGFGHALWQLPQIAYIQADAYWQPWHRKLNQWFDDNARYRNKPMIFIEYGPQTADLPEPYVVWQRDFRVVGWIGNMMPMAGPPVLWYHEEWDELELFRLQRAIMRFNEGFDPRGLNLRKVNAATSNSDHVFCQAKAGDGIAMFYAYHDERMADYPAPDAVPEQLRLTDQWVELSGLEEGRYRLEWWDTYAGDVIGEDELVVEGSRTRIELPTFTQDIAAKLLKMQD